jgi:hypothetical protein
MACNCGKKSMNVWSQRQAAAAAKGNGAPVDVPVVDATAETAPAQESTEPAEQPRHRATMSLASRST